MAHTVAKQHPHTPSQSTKVKELQWMTDRLKARDQWHSARAKALDIQKVMTGEGAVWIRKSIVMMFLSCVTVTCGWMQTCGCGSVAV